MLINVTAADIKRGRPRIVTNDRCPVALALKRATGIGYLVGTDWYKRPNGKKQILPAIAQVKILALCDIRPVKPFSFELPVRKRTKKVA